jgi:hypothetical protein
MPRRVLRPPAPLHLAVLLLLAAASVAAGSLQQADEAVFRSGTLPADADGQPVGGGCCFR